ncbi:heme ABC transporter permease [Endozoicomonas montiporae]|uniref:Heme exporter protein C n=2 Tax=Endozoicomonas montiporae TaxID=1027273 RepID=A0A081NC17_9GAMM|nr:heme ABC transporter permease [Endozoicomonas montiporae]AMO56312.1 heme exporter protein CcmC [Endozoicomonas montiporae CL-33]KEQ15990.1 heme ABC transporter permease [Endozoicomonas montiporae]
MSSTLIKKWFHSIASPRGFYQFSGRLMPWLAAITGLLMVTGLVWGLLFTPPDYLQGNSYRIIFIHVPVAFLASAAYVMMAAAGAVTLIWRIKLADVLLKAAAPVGASFCFLALVTGAIWGKPTWGTWWIWDARLTSVLILLFLYFGVIALRGAIASEHSASKACAVLTLVGVVNIPIIKFSVQWWNTLHQGATLTLTEKPSMAPEMLYPLLISIAGFYLFFLLVLLLRMRTEILNRERRTQWVQTLTGNGLEK